MPTISISATDAFEGDSAGNSVVFIIELDAPAASDVTFELDWSGGTATQDDVLTSFGTLGPYTITAGATSFPIALKAIGDTDFEPDETVIMTLVSVSGADISPTNGSATATILNDDPEPLPILSIADSSGFEGDAGGNNDVTFTATLSEASTTDVTFDLTVTLDGTADAGDFSATVDGVTVPITIPAGQTDQQIAINAILGDLDAEPDETFSVSISNIVGADPGDVTATGTILNDDAPPPTLSINNAVGLEGDAGSDNSVLFTATLSEAASTTVTFDLTITLDGTADASDFVPDVDGATIQVEIPAGQTSQGIDINAIVGDLVPEQDESFTVTISNIVGATAGDVTGIGTILNDDVLVVPEISIGNTRLAEGDSGTKSGTIFVFLDEPTTETVTFYLRVSAPATNALDSTDVVTNLAGLAVSGHFEPGETVVEVEVAEIIGDTDFEPDESFNITLENVQFATIAPGGDTAVLTVDNDDAPTGALAGRAFEDVNGNGIQDAGETGIAGITFSLANIDFSETVEATTDANGDYLFEGLAEGFYSSRVFVDFDAYTLSPENAGGDDAIDSDFNPDPLGGNFGPSVEIVAGQTVANVDAGFVPYIPPTISISDATVVEGDAGTTQITFTVSLDAPSIQDVGYSIELTPTGVNPANDADFSDPSGNVLSSPGVSILYGGRITAGDTTSEQTFLIQGDTDVEPDETFLATIVDATRAVIGDGEAIGTILNDDLPPPSYSIDDPVVNEDAGTVTFTITRSGDISQESESLLVDFIDGTAQAPDDWNAGGFLPFTFAPNETTKTFSVQIIDDQDVEPDETFSMKLMRQSDQTVLATGTTTIVDNDVPKITLEGGSLTEGDSGTKALSFLLNVDQVLTSPVVITVRVDHVDTDASDTVPNGSTPIGSDVTFAIPAGTDNFGYAVSILGDTDIEPDERLKFTVVSVTGAEIDGPTEVFATILNDDFPPTEISVTGVDQEEGDAGITNMVHTVTRTGDLSQPLTIDWGVTDIDTDAADFIGATSGSATFSINSDTVTFMVQVAGDTDFEDDELYSVTVTERDGPATDDADSTIINDDAAPTTYSIDDPVVNEGDGTVTFTITRSGDLSQESEEFSVGFFNGSAQILADWNANLELPFTFAPNETTKTFTASIIDDQVPESTETFSMRLRSISDPATTIAEGVATIIDDDTLPELTISGFVVNEGDSGTTTGIALLRLSEPAPTDVTFDVTWEGGTADSNDVTVSLPISGPRTIPQGADFTTASIVISGDTDIEPSETLIFRISNLQGATAPETEVTNFIANDDGPIPTFSIGDATIVEGDTGTKVAQMTITLSEALPYTASVDVTPQFGTADASDIQSPLSFRTITFDPGEVSKTTDIRIFGDTDVEDDETFLLQLGNAIGAGIDDGEGVLTIEDNDAAPPVISIAASDTLEGDLPTDSNGITFLITLDKASSSDVEFSVDFGPGAADASDVATPFGVLGPFTIPAGQTTFAIAPNAMGDTDVEPDETVIGTLVGVTGATISPTNGSATASILNDDVATSPPLISLIRATSQQPDPLEGDAGDVTPFVVTLTRTPTDGQPLNFESTVDVELDLTNPALVFPAELEDFVTNGTPFLGTVTFPATTVPGPQSIDFTVEIAGDDLYEGEGTIGETFFVQLANPANAVIDSNQSFDSGFIIDDDEPALPVVSVLAPTPATIIEGDPPAQTTVEFVVQLDQTSAQDVTVELIFNFDDTAPADFQAVNGFQNPVTVTIAAGETEALVPVVVKGDNAAEPDESFSATISNPVNATLGATTASATIIDDDTPPATGSIGGTIFFDADGDGIEDLSESGIASVSISLFDSLLNPLATETTDANGTYLFEGLAAGDYFVQLDNTDPTLAISPKDVGSDDTVDSDFSDEPIDAGLSDLITVGAGETVTNVDGGLMPLGSISGRVFVDLNGNNVDDGEPGVSGAVIELANSQGQLVDTFNTLVDGSYSFAFLPADDYTLSITPPGAEGLVTADVGDDATDSDFAPGTQEVTVVLAAGQDLTDVDAGIEAPATLPVIDVSPTVKLEGDSGTSDSSIFVFLSEAVDYEVTFELAFASAAVDGIGPDDIDPDLNGQTLTGSFAPGETSVQVPVTGIKGDTIVEADEVYDVTLQTIVGATPGVTQTTFEIRNDDEASDLPIAQIGAVVAPEGDVGVTPFNVRVFLSEVSDTDVTGELLVTPGAVDPADDADIDGSLPLTLPFTIPAGSLDVYIPVGVNGDTTVEPDERLTVEIQNLSGATWNATPASVAIIDDDVPTFYVPSLEVGGVSEFEGDAGATVFEYVVERHGDTSGEASLDWTVVPGAGDAANADDFGGAFPSGTVTFADGEESKSIFIEVSGDADIEPNESFVVQFSNPVGAELPQQYAEVDGTILNDDQSFTIAPLDAVKNEGDSGPTAFTFLITREGLGSDPVEVSWGVSGSGANPADAADFNGAFPSGSVTFGPNETEKTVTVLVSGDLDIEADETFMVDITGVQMIPDEEERPQITAAAVQALVVGPTGQGAEGTILNDDEEVQPPQVDVIVYPANADKHEGDHGTTPFSFSVTRSGDLGQATSVDWAIDPDQTDGQDFQGPLSGTVHFAPNEHHATVTLDVVGDTIVEPDEAFHIVLSNPVNAVISQHLADGVIRNDDQDDHGEHPDHGGGSTPTPSADCIEHFPTPTLVGSDNGETLRGGSGFDAIDAKGGHDIVFGADGDDYARGGEGDDTLKGNGGNDKLYGEEGEDYLKGDSGDDRLDGGADDDRLQGGAGRDSYVFGRGYGTDRVLDFRSNESIIFFGAGLPSAAALMAMFVDTADGASITLDDGSTLILEGVGTNSLSTDQFLFEDCAPIAGGGEQQHGGGEEQHGGGEEQHGGGEEQHGGGEEQHGGGEEQHGGGEEQHGGGEEQHGGGEEQHGGGDNGPTDPTQVGSEQSETLRGGSGSDVIVAKGGHDIVFGADGDDHLYGGEGDDTLKGNGGDDHVFGGAGNDLVKGDAGNDTLDGGADNDTLIGGAGVDAFVFRDGYGEDRIEDLRSDETVLIETAAYGDEASVLAAFTDGAEGAVLDLGGGDVLTLVGWSASALTGDQIELL